MVLIIYCFLAEDIVFYYFIVTSFDRLHTIVTNVKHRNVSRLYLLATWSTSSVWRVGDLGLAEVCSLGVSSSSPGVANPPRYPFCHDAPGAIPLECMGCIPEPKRQNSMVHLLM